MPYQRKTRDEFHLLSNYGSGWQVELTEDSRKEIRERLKEYRENCPQYAFRTRKVRVRITQPLAVS